VKQTKVKVLSNRRISPGHYILEVASDSRMHAARPGQFVQILVDDANDPLLPRPFSFLDTGRRGFRILYQVVGNGTELLSTKKKGDTLMVTGPLGNGFQFERSSDAILVGGGVGIPPLYHMAKTYVSSRNRRASGVSVFLGGRNKALLHCERDFKALGLKVLVATDNGSKGRRGFVTEIVEEYLRNREDRREAVIYACGPTPMLKAVSQLSTRLGVRCQVSVEECMPCGFGACLGCAIRVRDHGGYRYAMSCTEGPVFDAKEILWD